MSVPDTGSGPTISVVIPCYNARRWIGATLRSVFAQELAPFEVLVVDDGSRDGSAELVAQEFPQVRVLRQANAGVSAARNHGVREARGEWIAFVDADDIWLPSKLRLQWEALRALSQAQLCYTAWTVWPSAEPEPPPELMVAQGETRHGPQGWIYCELLVDCEVWTSTVLMRRSLFLDLGGFDEKLVIGEDYDLWLRCSRQAPIARLDLPLALYRQHPSSLTQRAPSANFHAMVVERAIERWGLKGPDGRDADARAVARSLARSWRNYALVHLQVGDRRVATRACAQSLRLNWNDFGTWKLALRSLLARRRPTPGQA